MKKIYNSSILFSLCLGFSSLLFSQNVAINTSGNSAYTSAILDLSNHNTSGTVGFLPPYVNLNLPLTNFQLTGTASQSNGIIIYSTGSGTAPAGLYYWNNTGSTWVSMGGGSSLSGTGTTNYLARWTSATALGVGVTQDNGTEVGIQTSAYAFTAGNPLLQVTANSTNIAAIEGISSQTGGAGVIGSITTTGIGGYAVEGLNASTVGGGNQFALYGLSTATSGNGYGLFSGATGATGINYAGYFEATGGTKNYAIVVPSGKGNSGFGTTNPYSTVDDSGSFGTGTYNFTTGAAAGSYTLTTLANASTYIATPPATGTYTLNLPSPTAAPRQIYTIVYNGSGLGTIAIKTPLNSIYQNGVSANPISLTGGSVVLQSDGTNWQITSSNGIASANNGLSVSGTSVQLGGNNLIHASNVPLNGNTLAVTGSSVTTTFTSTGQVGIGTAAPNAKAVVDLNNTNNWGLMLAGMTTANLPAITAAQNGLMVFNSSIGCPEYANGGVWYPIGLSHGTTTFSYSAAVQTFTVPNCATSLTIVATGGGGGTSEINLPGYGAIVTETFTVTPGETLDVVTGQAGVGNDYSGGGGGGTFVWNTASTTYPLVAAGGGGGGGYSSAGANGSTTTTPTASAGSGAAGTGGGAGAEGNTTKNGAGGGGAGWNTLTGNPTANTAFKGAGGLGKPGTFTGGAGATDTPGSNGGYGGGGGGGYNGSSTYGGGGGGSGYNGGGGGNATSNTVQNGGGGGGSGYYNGATFVSPTSVSVNTTSVDGSLTISY